MSRWREVQKGALPRGPGVYVVYQDNQVVYVGSTLWLEYRCRVYRRRPRRLSPYRGSWLAPWGSVPVDSIRIKAKCSRRLGDWLMWEYRLIRRLKPKYNRAGA